MVLKVLVIYLKKKSLKPPVSKDTNGAVEASGRITARFRSNKTLPPKPNNNAEQSIVPTELDPEFDLDKSDASDASSDEI